MFYLVIFPSVRMRGFMKFKFLIALSFLIPSLSHSYSEDIPVDDLNNFVNIYNKIKSEFIGDVENSDLIKYAIKGMVSSLDEHSQYLVGEEVDVMNKSITGKFSGIGVELMNTDDGLLVISPLIGAPAYRAGILSGDIITSVNSISTRSKKSLDMAISSLVGDSKEPVRIIVNRDDIEIEFSVVREVINIKSVTSNVYKNIGVLRINVFQRGAYDDFKSELNKINKSSDLKGLIVDLRGNSGGLVNEAVEIADYLTERGKSLLITERKSGSFNNISKIDKMFNKPIVVIIDKGSASASEILAGSLKDNGEAVVVGDKSFGKGTIQSVSDYENGDVLVMTTATYLTPNGIIIQSNGVEPDFYIDLPRDLTVDIKSKKNDKKHKKTRLRDDLYIELALREVNNAINALK